MAQKSGIIAISLSVKTKKDLERLQTKFGKNRSQLIREIIDYYFRNYQKSFPAGTPDKVFDADATEINKILKYYYQIITDIKPKPAIVIGIAVINKKNKVLIGLRKNRDQYVKNLSWTFPSGKFTTLEFENEIIKTSKQETGFTCRVEKLIHARIIPDSPEKKIRIIALYYHLKTISGKQNAGSDFRELKWIPATEVTRYFTTSVSDEIMIFLGGL